jgi:hypothetical protein
MLCGSFHSSKARSQGFLRVAIIIIGRKSRALSVIVPLSLIGCADEVVE